MAIIELPDHNLTTSAARRSKVWMKVLTGVDTTKADGYAFAGRFVGSGETIEVADGTWIMSYIEDVRSSGRMDGRNVTLYQVRNGALVKVESWYLDANRGWALKIRDTIAAHLAAPATPPAESVIVQFGGDLYARLDAEATRRGKSPTDTIRELVAEALG